MKLAQSLLPLLLCVRAVPAAADVLTDFFPPDTKLVFGIRVHNLELSSVAQTFAKQAQAAGANWLKLVPLAGFDLLRDVDEIMLCNNAQGKTPPSLIVVAGRFDVLHLAEGAQMYHKVPIWGGVKEQDSLVAFLDDHTVLLGDPALVRSAIDRREDGARIDPAFNDRITSLRQRYDIWGLGDRPEGFVTPDPDTKGLEAMDRFQFGMQLATGLEISAEVHARSSKDLEKLKDTLHLVSALLKGQTPSANGAKFDLQVEDSTIKLAISVPEAELHKMIRTEIAAHSHDVKPAAPDTPTLASTPAPEIAPAPAPAPPVKPATIAAVKPAPSQVTDKEGNTLILKLPGKK
jgi:hypothetical protein